MPRPADRAHRASCCRGPQVIQVHPGGQDVLQRAVMQAFGEGAPLRCGDGRQLGEQHRPVRDESGDRGDPGPLDPRKANRRSTDAGEDDDSQHDRRPGFVVRVSGWRSPRAGRRRRWERRHSRRRPSAVGWPRGPAAGRTRRAGRVMSSSARRIARPPSTVPTGREGRRTGRPSPIAGRWARGGPAIRSAAGPSRCKPPR